MKVSLSIHTRHDANISIGTSEGILMYLEMEKITGERYFSFNRNQAIFRQQWEKYVAPSLVEYEVEEIIFCWLFPEQESAIRSLFPNVNHFSYAAHHLCHVHSAYLFTLPQAGDLILSFDGGGDQNDVFKIYRWEEALQRVVEIFEAPLNLGTPYRLLGILSPELSEERRFSYDHRLDLPGKIMGLAAFGTVRSFWKPGLFRYLTQFHTHHGIARKPLAQGIAHFLSDIEATDLQWGASEARDLLATLQIVFEEIVIATLTPWVQKISPKRILIVGGCALNVRANTVIAKIFQLPAFVPPCPNDSGISLGAMRMRFPGLPMIPAPFTSIPLTGKLPLPYATCHMITATIHQVANELVQGKVIGVVRGPLEIGPRALGHRSILASPGIPGMKDRLNRIKGREYFRPVAPIITEEAFPSYFEKSPLSPFMSFAPKAIGNIPAIAEGLHIDGSARVQTVSKQGEFIYDLLNAVATRNGHPVLLNTSLNAKGKPLVNDLNLAFHLFNTSDMDGLLVENSLLIKS